MDWKPVQARLAARKFYDGDIDGDAGPMTYGGLFEAAAGRELGPLALTLGRAMVQWGGAYAVASPLRLAHFLGQGSLETGGFRYFTEIWGPTPAQRGYEGRADLGNTQAGDGFRYRGRGIFQITGRDNYKRGGVAVGLDLVSSPALAAEPGVSVHLALDYWKRNGLSAWADQNNAAAVSRGINRGNPRAPKPANHEAERIAATNAVKAVLL
jgi:putative chitinase